MVKNGFITADIALMVLFTLSRLVRSSPASRTSCFASITLLLQVNTDKTEEMADWHYLTLFAKTTSENTSSCNEAIHIKIQWSRVGTLDR